MNRARRHDSEIASLSQQFDITGLEDMKEVLGALAFQGKEGAFELKDAASQFQRLAPHLQSG